MEPSNNLNTDPQPAAGTGSQPSPPEGPYMPAEYTAEQSAEPTPTISSDADETPELEQTVEQSDSEEPDLQPKEDAPKPEPEAHEPPKKPARRTNNHDKMSWVLVGVALAVGLLAGLGIGYFFINQGANPESAGSSPAVAIVANQEREY